ncbi:hypothetical protein PINS_up007412 [Pythium insidiosum]|nr:hypothetical protein PINS_up007412 [Pythium insidiosum]
MDVLAWTLKHVVAGGDSAVVDQETPLHVVLARVLADARASVEPLALAMGYADALPLDSERSTAANARAIAERVLLQLQLIHGALLHDMGADPIVMDSEADI